MRVLASCCVLMWWVGAGAAGAQPRVHPVVTVPVVAHFTGVDIDAVGRVFLIDSARGALEAYDARGRLLARAVLGAGGASAGDAALSVGPAGEIWVAEGRRLTQFALAHGALEARSHFDIPFDARDVCATKGMVYVLGYQRDTVVHEFSATGRRIRSFGAPPQGPNTLARDVLSGGRLACDADGVGVAFLYRASVTRYAPSGAMQWSAPIHAFTPLIASVDAAGTLMMFPPDGGYDSVISLLQQGDTVVAGVAHRTTLGKPDSDIESVREIELLRTTQVARESTPVAARRGRWSVVISTGKVFIRDSGAATQ